DKWLWQARFFKTRSLASRVVTDGQVRVNAQRVSKAATSVRPGDVLTFAQGARVRVIKITALGLRRGPASEAQGLFEDLTPDPEPGAPELARVGPRPTKRDRRALDAFQDDQGPDA
ncbi:MAG: RNA-binding S4 domain-containing protein, partial [Proteobacteria bacterium]|nr:RNA-binding S4 domain-containing protein [Pseudomonadota bacterium]